VEKDRSNLLLWFKHHGFSPTETRLLCEHIQAMETRRNRLQSTVTSNFFLLQITYHHRLIQLLENKLESHAIRSWEGNGSPLTATQDATITQARRLLRLERELKKTKPQRSRK
jgi:hypothetical protein